MQRRSFLKIGLAGAVMDVLPLPSMAAGSRELRMGVTSPPTSLDPQFQDAFISVQATQQIFSTLLSDSSSGVVKPNLASAWKVVDDTTWELTLRSDVKFHDGTPFEPEDVLFSYERVPKVVGSSSPFTASTRNVKSIEIVSRTVIRFKLHTVDPIFDWRLTQVAMLSRKIHASATTADFTSGKAAIGTGPYKFVSYANGQELRLSPNLQYFGGKPAWDSVVIKYISDPGARIAALQSGDVDLIDTVPVENVNRLKQDKALALFETTGFLTIYLFPDSMRKDSPFVFDKDGKPLQSNPLQDVRVRQALSLAVDRSGIVTRLMSGQGTVADQMVSTAVPDRAPNMAALKTDLVEAKRLLAEAGYPNGFRMTLHGPNGYFPNDTNVAQAIAQGFSRIGITTAVEVAPMSVFATKATARAYSLFILGFNSPSTLITMQYLAQTKDAAAGLGGSNRQMYSNPHVDEALKRAGNEMDTARRNAALAEGMKALMADVGLIPVFYTEATWAGRKDRLSYLANPMGHSSAYFAKPV
ncbi:peptide/nickel transport system substrate-binding protein [Paraburkholderia fungorum]|uniref:Peptide/nickel transport system substrate-binding protein n=1 Tax=Paraburkholderia fungorum TaxID=134537 RepID=A0A1H1JW20_9BURK|nr:ABC transporter substrate-binding protein [Paraburkholderia fungorum]SDR53929.1 peptide/nickel transport system substrate-binding protein [Paraburkholderia fungorum]